MLNNILSKVNAIYEHGSGNASECGGDWFKYRDSCYFVISKKNSFQSAENECRQLNAHVVRLETKEENEFLKSYMDKHVEDTKIYWIGITDVEKEGVWKLSGTGRVVPYTDWKGNEPNDFRGREDCAVLHHHTQWSGWMDVPCENSYPVFCERHRERGTEY
ncbi:C-type lectin domain family 4 member E-like [Ruditapes philippinarum]|uniref:C-type lectin domain family 4 member E-like n=1 Tax=Ruditapes philippinarum TaxID=129788 RepID=UPI00295B20B7|nr:C-type lectin domain family 4 member E-like [Ruditapes philippinarum]